MYVDINELTNDVEWTPELLEARIDEMLSAQPATSRLRLPSLATD
jgi:hypothetical protein